MSSRLPIPGQDDGTWGAILNDFLSVEHNTDGTLKKAADIAQAKADAAQALTTAQQAASATIADNSVTKQKLATTIQASLDKADTALQTAPVTSVAGKTGIVNLGYGDIMGTPVLATVATSGSYTDLEDKPAIPKALTYCVDAYGADPTGVINSDTAVAAAMAAMGSSPGTIEFGPGTYKLNSVIGVFGANQNVVGAGRDVTKIVFTGTGDVIRAFRANYQTGTSSKTGGAFRGFSIDGTGAGAGSTAIHYGDLGEGRIENVKITNFTGTGSMGLYFHNVTGWTEKTWAEVVVRGCTQQIVFDGGGGGALASFDYSTFTFRVDANPSQDGVVFRNNCMLVGVQLNITGNFQTGSGNTGTGIIVGTSGSDTSTITGSTLHVAVETDGSTGTGHTTMAIGAAAGLRGAGVLNFTSGNGVAWATSVNARTRMSFAGVINVDSSIGIHAFAQGFSTQGAVAAKGGTMSGGVIYLDSGNYFSQTLTAGNNTLSFGSTTAQLSGRSMTFDVFLRQPSSGGSAVVTWPSGFTWVAGSAPTLSTVANAVDHIHVTTTDATTFYAQCVTGIDPRYAQASSAVNVNTIVPSDALARVEALSTISPVPVVASGTGTTLTAAVTTTMPAAAITVTGAVAKQQTGNTSYYQPSWLWPSTGANSYPNPGCWAVQFNTDSRYIEFVVRTANATPAYHLLIDGQPTTDLPQYLSVTAFTPYRIKFDLGSSAARRIRFVMQDMALSTIYTATGSSIWPARPRGQRLFVIGDSFAAGSGNSKGSQIGSFVYRLARYLGIEDVWNGGIGSTGWVASPGLPGASATFSGGTLTFSVAHGLAAGNPISFSNVGVTGLSVQTEYYVYSVSGNTLTITNTVGGSQITPSDGTVTVVPGKSYLSRALTDALPTSSDIVLFFGYYNDRNIQSDGISTGATAATAAANIAANAAAAFATLTAKSTTQPQVYVVGAVDPLGTGGSPYTVIDAQLQVACQAAGVPYISPTSGAIYSGSGSVITTQSSWINSGNRVLSGVIINTDGTVVFPTAHGLDTAATVNFSALTGVTGISTSTNYFAIPVDAVTVRLASSIANAVSGNNDITISVGGTGTVGWMISAYDSIHPQDRGVKLIARRIYEALCQVNPAYGSGITVASSSSSSGASATPTNVQVFTADGTWTMPSLAKSVRVVCIGAGGGGGAGCRGGATGTVYVGGGGAGGGGYSMFDFAASTLATTVTVTVGTGGAGAPAVTTDATAGSTGSNGGTTTFGSYVRATGGMGGVGGQAGGSGGTGGSAGAGLVSGGIGANASSTGFSGATAGSASGAPGGGAGGGITSAGAASNGGAGQISSGLTSGTAGSGGTAGGTVNGTNGTSSSTNLAGGSGGGGAAATAANAGSGALGGLYGAGGGGGGASLAGYASGAGGTGANGICIVTTYF